MIEFGHDQVVRKETRAERLMGDHVVDVVCEAIDVGSVVLDHGVDVQEASYKVFLRREMMQVS